MDFASLISDAQNSISDGMGDLLQQGGNAALGYVETQAVAALNADANQHAQAAKASISASLAKPGTPNGFGAYLQNLVSGPVMQKYGGALVLGVVGVGVVGYLLLK